MLNGCSLSILILGVLSSLGMVCLHIYTIAIDYPLNIFSSVQLNWSGVLSCIEIGLGTGILLLATVAAAPYVNIASIQNRGPLKFATIYYAIISLASVIVSIYRLSETGLMFDTGVCKRTEGSLVCPTVLFRTEMAIENKLDCVFNAFAESPSAWNKAGVPKIDWSNEEMYDKKSQSVVFEAYKLAREDIDINEDEMALYHDCWYWGCDEICNDRHLINVVMAYASAIVSVIYITLTVLSGIQSQFDYKAVETEQVKILDTIEIPKIVRIEGVPPGQGSPSDNNGTLSSPSKSWNFNLRM